MLVSEFPLLPANLAIFMPINLILKRSEAKFFDLRGKKLSVEQSDFFAGQCIGEMGHNVDIRFGAKCNDLKRRYSLPFGTVNRWIKNFKDPYAINHECRGRPDSLDAQGKRDFLNEVREGKQLQGKGGKIKKVLLTDEEIVVCLNNHARASRKRERKLVDEFNEDDYLHEDTINKLKKVSMF